MNEPQISCIYCDDIRHELNGKITLVGCYGPNMLVPEFPYTLSALVFSISLRLPLELEVSGPIELCAIVNETPAAGIKVDPNTPLKLPPYELGEVTEKLFSGAIKVQNLVINEPTILVVSAKINGTVYCSSKMRIMLHKEDLTDSE